MKGNGGEWMEFGRRKMVMRDGSIEKGWGDEWMVVYR